MSFDPAEILSRAWRITWSHKALWGAGFLMMLVALLIFPIMLFFPFMILASDNPSRWLDNPLFWVGLGFGFLFSIILSYGLGSLIRPALVAAVVKLEGGAERLYLAEVLREGLPYFWRFLGLIAFFALSVMLVSGVISVIQIVGTVVTMGLASLCLTPLSFLIYPLLYVGLIWLEFAETAIVVDGKSVMDALRRGWDVLSANRMPVLILALVVYLGIGMISALILVPFFIPWFFLPVFLVDHSTPREFLWIAGICSAVFLPVVIFLQGMVFVFMKASWTLMYLHLTGERISSPILAAPLGTGGDA